MSTRSGSIIRLWYLLWEPKARSAWLRARLIELETNTIPSQPITGESVSAGQRKWPVVGDISARLEPRDAGPFLHLHANPVRFNRSLGGASWARRVKLATGRGPANSGRARKAVSARLSRTLTHSPRLNLVVSSGCGMPSIGFIRGTSFDFVDHFFVCCKLLCIPECVQQRGAPAC